MTEGVAKFVRHSHYEAVPIAGNTRRPAPTSPAAAQPAPIPPRPAGRATPSTSVWMTARRTASPTPCPPPHPACMPRRWADAVWCFETRHVVALSKMLWCIVVHIAGSSRLPSRLASSGKVTVGRQAVSGKLCVFKTTSAFKTVFRICMHNCINQPLAEEAHRECILSLNFFSQMHQ